MAVGGTAAGQISGTGAPSGIASRSPRRRTRSRRARRRLARAVWRTDHDAAPTPARPLNSSISASQTGRIERRSRQQDAGAARLELLERHALLLHPREVAQVEDPVAVRPGQLEDVVLGGAEDVAPERLGRGDAVEAAREVARLDLGRARSGTWPRRPSRS